MNKLINKKYLNVVITRIIMAVVIGVLSVPNAYALFYDDAETSSGNIFSATNLDLGLASDKSNFEPHEDWIPGGSGEREFVVSNLGDLPFIYGLKYKLGNDDDLCGKLKLVVEYNGDEIYNGDLDEFNIKYDAGDPFLDHMMLPVGTDEHIYLFKIILPIDTDDELSDNVCRFDIAAYSWMETLEPYAGFWDEDALNNEIETTNWEEAECKIGQTVFMIGDEESAQTENPVDELNWPGAFGVFPDYDNPFVVGTSSDSDFPWNSNFSQNKATDFDIDFFYAGKSGLAKLTVSWSPGRSGAEQKEVFLDEESVGKTPNRTGVAVDGWWERMPIYQDEFIFPLEPGSHTLNMKHLKGDGTLWDYVKLEIVGCSADKGDVLINEVMWMGSTSSGDDEWIELFNDTDHDIALDYWTITNAGDGQDIKLPVGSVIPAQGYFLISNYDSDDSGSALADSVGVDYVVPDIDLDDSGEELILKDAFGNKIDEADGSGGWPKGDGGTPKESMERNDAPETGWHSCSSSECNDTTFWDLEGDDFGTPGAENKSDNDPSEQILAELGEPVLEEVPVLTEETVNNEGAQEETEDIQPTEAIINEDDDYQEQEPETGDVNAEPEETGETGGEEQAAEGTTNEQI